MNIIHLDPLIPSFLNELEKEAGLGDGLKKGVKKAITTIGGAHEKLDQLALKAMVRMQNHPIGNKIVTHGPELIRKLLT